MSTECQGSHEMASEGLIWQENELKRGELGLGQPRGDLRTGLESARGPPGD